MLPTPKGVPTSNRGEVAKRSSLPPPPRGGALRPRTSGATCMWRQFPFFISFPIPLFVFSTSSLSPLFPLYSQYMKILAIETSCDETAVAILDATGEKGATTYTVLGHALFSQASLHNQFGGVFPALAKREHGNNITPLLRACLEEGSLIQSNFEAISEEKKNIVRGLLEREGDTAERLIELLDEIEMPAIDAIAVTKGPGLEPALWVGINVAKALAVVWDIPLIPVNHMEGHIICALASPLQASSTKDIAKEVYTIQNIPFPLTALLISGGHTEFVQMADWDAKKVIGETRDDAVGESFDKVARMLSLPYPGGREISRQAQMAREENLPEIDPFPRPMIESKDCDVSFSGLKTSVLYRLKGVALTDTLVKQYARAFEDAVTEVLVAKSLRAIETTNAKAFVVGGGVASNQHIQNMLTNAIKNKHSDVSIYFPKKEVATDNAIMIAMAAYYAQDKVVDPLLLSADGRMGY